MLSTLRQRKAVRVLFDERHHEMWSIREETAQALRPSHPSAASYQEAADEIVSRGFDAVANVDHPLDARALRDVDVLVLARPGRTSWDHAGDDRSPVFDEDEIEAIRSFVVAGGGLLVLADDEEDKYGANLNRLLAPYDVRIESTTVRDYASAGAPEHVPAQPAARPAAPGLLHLVDRARVYGAGAVVSDRPGAVVLGAGASADPAGAGLLAAVSHGDGRVVVSADAALFGDDHLGEEDHRQLWLNLVYWLALPAFLADSTPLESEAARDPAWTRLREATNALRRMQGPKGEVDLEKHDAGEVREHVAAMATAIADLAPRFPHEREYLSQVIADLQAWVDAGCGQPDFQRSLALLRPERKREDGAEHLVVFPMYTPNASRDTRFEALITRTPWPEFVDRIERELYDNPKFVPVQLVANTEGYDSECAVLFPETVSVAEKPTNNFGAIFCDRESARFRRSTKAAAELLRLDLPPDAEALVSSADMALETYVLWDMIHDRWHSHGDLPFDPFMIRQRLPYWMYSLEELRVDLATYGTAGEMVRSGFPFARNVQYAILFDRLLRFPITGNRVRNYDGLGGQLLFAYLHHRGVVEWTDNRLVIDWTRVEDVVGELRAMVDELYRKGIDSSKVAYWIAAHDLVASYVRPNVGSTWQRDSRVYTDESDPKAWVDRALDDEFPLSMFYEALKQKLAA